MSDKEKPYLDDTHSFDDYEPDYTLDDLEWEETYPDWRTWGDDDDWDDDDPKGHGLECTCETCIQNHPEREIYLSDDEWQERYPDNEDEI